MSPVQGLGGAVYASARHHRSLALAEIKIDRRSPTVAFSLANAMFHFFFYCAATSFRGTSLRIGIRRRPLGC